MVGKGEVRPLHSVIIHLTAFVVLISIVPVFFISVTLLKRMETMTERELTQSYQWLVSEHISNAQDRLNTYENSMRYTARNSTILDALTRKDENPYLLGRTVSTELFKTISMEAHNEIRECVVYADGGTEVYGSRVTMFTEATERAWREHGWNGGEGWFLDTSWDGQELLCRVSALTDVDVESFTTRRVGWIRMELYLNQLFMPSAGEQDYQLVLADADGKVRYASDPALAENREEWPRSDAEVAHLENHIAVGRTLDHFGLKAVYLFDINESRLQKSALRKVIYSVAVLTALTIMALSYAYFRRFAARVDSLLDKFRRAATGDLSPTQPIGGEDELALLDTRFGEMLEEMDDLNKRSYAQQMEIRESQYRNLQLQINPHFLYNTLETISAIGATHQVFQICDLCEKLGDIFRYSLGKNEGKYTPVARELRQTQNYIFIQQVRYRFEVFYSIEIDAEQVYMLRFLLQPIVENAVLHGLAKKSQPGTLEVYIGRAGDDLEIRISDDGVGMDETSLSALRRRLNEPSDPGETGSSIGLWNISQRIHLSYGEQYGIEVFSKQGQGSAFTLRLPFITEGMMMNEEV